MGSDNKKNLSQTKLILLLFCVAAGIALMVFSSAFEGGEKKDDEAKEALVLYDERAYEEQLVEKIEGLCSSVRGVSGVSVAVTLDGTYKAVYAKNVQSGDSHRSEYVLVGNGASEGAVLVGYSPPDILGVGIVCKGASNESTRAELIALVSSALDIPMNKIYVAPS